jgi:nicotinamide-nucleotide amidase
LSEAHFNAEIIAVGSEMLTSQRVDTNSLYITDHLNTLGVEVRRKLVIGDDRAILTAAIKHALMHVEILFLSGGLGPTEDDLTRDAVAAALDRKLIFNQDICDSLEARFKRRGRPMAEINKRQAYLIEGAEVLPNPNGTAVGQWISVNGKFVVMLPGPPSELKPMMASECMPRLQKLLPAQVIRTRVYRITGLTESDLDQLIAPVYTKVSNPVTTVLAHLGDMQVHLRARSESADEAERLLAETGDPIEALLGDRIYSHDGESLEQMIGKLLTARGETLSLAESLTGGMVGERITSVAGSSEYFAGGFLVYNDRMKHELLGIDQKVLDTHTAVSEQVACAMASESRARTGSTYAVSTTGEAGPTSNSGHAPGTVFIGFSGPGGTAAHRYSFPPERSRVRAFTTQTALDQIRRHLLGLPSA